MGKWMRNIRLTQKVYLLAGMLILSFLLMMELLVVPAIRSAIQDGVRDKIRNIVETAVQIAASYDAKAKAGEMTEEEAKAKAAEIISLMRYGATSSDYLWINDSRPFMIMHPLKPEMNGTDLSTYADPTGFHLFDAMTDAVKQKGEGFIPYQWAKPGKDLPQPKESYVKGFQPWDWIIGTGVYVDDLMALEAKTVNTIHAFLAGLILLAFLFVLLMVLPLRRDLGRISGFVAQLGRFDFSKGLEMNQRDELGRIHDELDGMRKVVGGLAGNVGKVGLEVQDATQEMNRQYTELSHASDQVASAIQELAKGATHQAQAVEESNSRLTNIIDSLSGITDSMQDSLTQSDQARTMTREGERTLEKQETRMRETRAMTTRVSEAITGLTRKSDEIVRFVDIIQGIASQTNLLALNAAIEAARAGDQGRGFAVVADEVRKLSEQSSHSVSQISQIVDEIGRSVQETAQEAHNVSAAVEEQQHALGDSRRAFEGITSSVNTIAEHLASVSGETDLMVKKAREAGDALQSIAAISEENAAASEEIAATTEQQAATIQSLSHSALQVAENAVTLMENVGKFTL